MFAHAFVDGSADRRIPLPGFWILEGDSLVCAGEVGSGIPLGSARSPDALCENQRILCLSGANIRPRLSMIVHSDLAAWEFSPTWRRPEEVSMHPMRVPSTPSNGRFVLSTLLLEVNERF